MTGAELWAVSWAVILGAAVLFADVRDAKRRKGPR